MGTSILNAVITKSQALRRVVARCGFRHAPGPRVRRARRRGHPGRLEPPGPRAGAATAPGVLRHPAADHPAASCVAIYLPGVIRGESVAPAGARADDQWFGGRRDTRRARARRPPTDTGGAGATPAAPAARGDRRCRRVHRTQRVALDQAIRAAEQVSRFEFSVFVGTAEGEPRLSPSGCTPRFDPRQRSVLVMVDPAARLIEVVTGAEVRRVPQRPRGRAGRARHAARVRRWRPGARPAPGHLDAWGCPRRAPRTLHAEA